MSTAGAAQAATGKQSLLYVNARGIKSFGTVGAGNSALRFDAVTPGVAGDAITVTLQAGATTAANTAGDVVTVDMAPGATLAEVITAIKNDAATSALVFAARADRNVLIDSVPAPVGPVTLAGGSDTPIYTLVEGVRNLSGPGIDKEFADSTTMDTDGGYRTQEPSWKVPGALNFDVNYYPDNVSGGQEECQYGYENDVCQEFRLHLASPRFDRLLEFAGYIRQFSPSADPGDILTASVVLEISGKITRK